MVLCTGVALYRGTDVIFYRGTGVALYRGADVIFYRGTGVACNAPTTSINT